MAQGDVVTLIPTSIANDATINIQPASGAEWVIQNIYFGGAVEIYKTDGTNSVLIESVTSAGSRLGAIFNVTNGAYLQVKNKSGASIFISYDGRVLK